MRIDVTDVQLSLFFTSLWPTCRPDAGKGNLEKKGKDPPVGCTQYLSSFFIILRKLLYFMLKYCTYERIVTSVITLNVLFLVPEAVFF
jgi:hypothetical protein